MKKTLLIIFFLFLMEAVFPSPVNAVTPSLSPTPTTEPIPVENVVCPNNGTVYPPNSKCYSLVETFEIQEVKLSGDQFFTYPLSCIEAPNVTYKETYTDYSPPPSTRDVIVTTDISEAQLGFLGPDSTTLASSNPDALAKKYLFNALFDRPGADPNAPKESFRAYWRMLDSLSQAQIKAFYIDNVNNHTYYYVGIDGKQRVVKLDALKSKLPSCLKNYSPNSVCWKGNRYVDDYLGLDTLTKEEYDALLPFDFDNMRSYIVGGATVSKENIPYLKAILSGLKGQKTLLTSVPGLFDFYTPNWAIQDLTQHLSAPVALEYLQSPSLILRASLAPCIISPKNSSLSSPKTYPSDTNINQKVTVPVKSVLIESDPDECVCGLNNIYCQRYIDCEAYVNDQVACMENGCIFRKGQDTYELTGNATGDPLTVFNNPYVESLTDLVMGGKDPVANKSSSPIVSNIINLLNGVIGFFSNSQPSFYKMLLPSFAPDPEKVLVSAPIVKNTTDNTYATVQGSSIIYRENNLAQDTMRLLQNCWLVPNDNQSSPACGTIKNIPSTCPSDCDKNIPSAATAMALKPKFSEIAHAYLGSLGAPLLDKYETVVNSAVAAGINPIFALTIWLNESGVSNYEGVCQYLGKGDLTSGYCTKLQDFGINLDAISSNWAQKKFFFDEQLQNFLLLPNFYKNTCKAEMERYQCPMRVFMAMFKDGTCEPSAGSDAYLDSKITIFSWFAPNEKFPCYPSAYP